MNKFFNIEVVYSDSHLVFPRIIVTVVVVLGLLVLLTEGLANKKAGKKFFGDKIVFLQKNYDKKKFWGTLLLFIIYILAMDIVGFLIASLVCIFLFNLLFTASLEKKSVLVSALISAAFSFGVWYVFGQLFNITLPSGIF